MQGISRDEVRLDRDAVGAQRRRPPSEHRRQSIAWGRIARPRPLGRHSRFAGIFSVASQKFNAGTDVLCQVVGLGNGRLLGSHDRRVHDDQDIGYSVHDMRLRRPFLRSVDHGAVMAHGFMNVGQSRQSR